METHGLTLREASMGNGSTQTKPGVALSDPGGPGVTASPPDPVPWHWGLLLGIYFLVAAALTFYLLVATWPVAASDPNHPDGFREFALFGWKDLSAPSDLRIFFTVIAAGALGSLIHSLTSFADFVGERSLSSNWIWWFVLRIPVGLALALVFSVVLRGGIAIPSLPGRTAADGATLAIDATRLLNPYGIAAVSALAGMFSKQATDKLREIFDTVFRTQEPVIRADPLTPRAIPVISGTDPTKLTVATGPLTPNVLGRGFQRDCNASINATARSVQWVSDGLLKLTLLAEDVAAKGGLRLIVQNPGPAGGESEPFVIPVEGVDN